MKERLDVLLVGRGLAASREKAKAVIMAGNVYVDGQKEDKAGSMFPETVKIEVRGHVLPYVSRGGLKLEKAMTRFDLELSDKVCMDVGSSTGGFTDCMLQNGARKVYAVDVGHGQLDWKLRNDSRVVCMERTNIRYVTPEDLAEPVQFVSIDVSFISLTAAARGPDILSVAADDVAVFKFRCCCSATAADTAINEIFTKVFKKMFTVKNALHAAESLRSRTFIT